MRPFRLIGEEALNVKRSHAPSGWRFGPKPQSTNTSITFPKARNTLEVERQEQWLHVLCTDPFERFL